MIEYVEGKTGKEWREHMKRLHEGAFADHKLKEEGVGRWLCCREGTGMFHFRVVESGQSIILHGDIRALVLNPSGGNPIGWLRGVLSPDREISVDYFMEKVDPVLRQQQVFLEKEAMEIADEEIQRALEDDGEERAAKAREWKEDYLSASTGDDGYAICGGFTTWCDHYYNWFGDSEGMDAPLDWGSQLFCKMYALRRFVALLEESEEKDASGAG